MELNPLEVAKIAQTYHLLRCCQDDIRKAETEGPKGIPAVEDASRKLKALEREYTETVPEEVRAYLDLHVNFGKQSPIEGLMRPWQSLLGGFP
jgi:hypothetical protein